MPGPAASKNARRRNARPDWRTLPATGRAGKAPAWPLDGKRPKGHTGLWRDLWSTAQAVAWEDLGWTRLVARYSLLLLEAETPGASAAILGEVRQLEDRLGLSPMAMRRLQWEIGQPAVEGDAEVANLDDYRDLYGTG